LRRSRSSERIGWLTLICISSDIDRDIYVSASGQGATGIASVLAFLTVLQEGISLYPWAAAEYSNKCCAVNTFPVIKGVGVRAEDDSGTASAMVYISPISSLVLGAFYLRSIRNFCILALV